MDRFHALKLFSFQKPYSKNIYRVVIAILSMSGF